MRLKRALLIAMSGLSLCAAFAAAADSRMTNMSTRGQVGTGDNVLIGGLIIPGSDSKVLVIRAISSSIDPSLVAAEDQLPDPFLQLFSSTGALIDSNNNWADHNNAGLIPTVLQPSQPNEAAIYTTLGAGAYTAIVSGIDASTGVALVEIYEVDQGEPTRLGNISTRGVAGTGDNVLIGGLIISGDTSMTVAIRAIGSSIDPAFVAESDQLQDPQLQLFSGPTQIEYNNNWQDAANSGDIPEGLRPTDPFESVILTTLAPGAYTAIVSGIGNTTGVGLVEVFEVNNAVATLSPAETFFRANVSDQVIQGNCRECHFAGGLATSTPLLYASNNAEDYHATNFEVSRSYIDGGTNRASMMLQRALGGLGHGGGPRYVATDQGYLDLEQFLGLLEDEL